MSTLISICTSCDHSSDLTMIIFSSNIACGSGNKTMLQIADIMTDAFCGPNAKNSVFSLSNFKNR